MNCSYCAHSLPGGEVLGILNKSSYIIQQKTGLVVDLLSSSERYVIHISRTIIISINKNVISCCVVQVGVGVGSGCVYII